VLRSRQRGQSVVEFGIVAILFTLLMFAVVDFGLLLNSWVAISSGTRQVARAATVGFLATDLTTMVNGLNLPGVSRASYPPFTKYCCGEGGSNDEIVLTVQYYNGDPSLTPAPCIPGAAGCNPVSASSVDNHFWGGTYPCPTWTPTTPCPNIHPLRGDMIVVSISSPGMEVVTPLVRPFFGCSSSQVHCNVRLASSAMMRYEGQ
jgi:TadE-like protein